MPRTQRGFVGGLMLRRFSPVCLILAVLLGASGGCEAPEAPTWDVDLTIPVTNKLQTLAELVEDEENIGVDSLGTLTLAVEQVIERVEVEDEIQIDPFSDQATYELGVIEIPTPAPSAQSLSFQEIWPPAVLWDGQYHQVVPFTFDIQTQLPAFGSFAQATFASAFCEVEVHNELPVPIESAQLTFLNAVAGTVAGVAVFNQPIPAGGTGLTTMNLSGRHVEAVLDVDVEGSAGASGEPVLISSDDELSVEIRFVPTVTVSSAVTTVSPQTVVRSEAIDLGSGARAGEVEFLDGWLAVTIQNESAVQALVTLALPEIFDAAGDTLIGQTMVLPGESPTIGFDLSGAAYDPVQAGEAQIRVTMQVDSGGQQVQVASTDQVSASVVLAAPARVASFTGVLDPTIVAIQPTETTIDLPEGLDQVVFAGAVMLLELDNTAGFPIDLDVELVGSDAERGMVVVPVRERVEAASGSVPTRTTIVLDQSNSNIVDLMNLMPTSIELRGDALIGDGVTSGTIVRGDYIEGTATLRAPLEVQLGADRLTTDPDELEIDEDTRDIIRDDVSHGTITADLINHLPTGATLHLLVSRTLAGAGNPDATGNLVLSGTIDAPPIGPDGLVSASRTSQLEFELDEDDLAIFAETPIYTGVVIDIDGTGGQTVRFLASDWVRVRAVAVMRTRVHFD